jgi:hypothetical protein
MKNIITLLSISLYSLSVSAQSLHDTTMRVFKKVDLMDESVHYYLTKTLYVSEDDVKGFIIKLDLKSNGNGFEYDGVTVKAAKLGSCQENSYLTILFDDTSRTKLTMWNKFNCNNTIYMDYKGQKLSELNKPIKAIRFTNGYSHESYTLDLKGLSKYYFMDCITLINSQLTTPAPN